MRSSFNWYHFAGALALALPLLTLARAEEELKNPFAGDAAAAVEGKRLFLKTGCYACHGHEAEGAVGPDLTDDEWIYKPTDSMIFNTIARGRSGTVMAPFGDQLKPDEIWKIVEFLRDKNRQRHLKGQ
ncbi:MAG TPA: c-type cytochrome [Burkholderiales bacterium]|nr:c-type cytochrome [Burkholderiales bacterium]